MTSLSLAGEGGIAPPAERAYSAHFAPAAERAYSAFFAPPAERAAEMIKNDSLQGV